MVVDRLSVASQIQSLKKVGNHCNRVLRIALQLLLLTFASILFDSNNVYMFALHVCMA